MKSPFRFIDGSLPISSLLYEEEEFITSQEGVGLYEGKDKTPERQNGSIHLTTHRLMYIDNAHPHRNSLSITLSSVKQTEFYAGFLTSSPKITIYLNASGQTQIEPSVAPTNTALLTVPDLSFSSWICPVCSYNNPFTASETRPKCVLCGVPRDDRAIPAAAPSSSRSVHRSPSMPSLINSSPSKGITPSTNPSESSTEESTIACPACTYLNHPSMRNCEICGTTLNYPQRSSRSTPAPSSADSPHISGSVLMSGSEALLPPQDMLRISFRKGGSGPFYDALKKAMLKKAWELNGTGPSASRTRTVSAGGPSSRLGIQGIFETIGENARQVDQNISESLRDLEALRVTAKDMVQLASSLNAKLTAQEEEIARQKALFPDLQIQALSISEPEEATFIRSSLAQLGLPTVAVTQDMVKDEDRYHQELAKELAGVLSGKGITGKGMMGGGEAIIGLDEVWRGWNRARGVALVPPSLLLLCVPYLAQFTSPRVDLRIFRSGLRVLHTPKYSDNAFAERIGVILSQTTAGYKTTIQVATEEQISVGLAQEMIESVEDAGTVVRDDGGANDETRWYVNMLDNYTWDGYQEEIQ